MKTLIILYVSITWLSGVLSSEQLVQSGPAVINPGSSHTMTCQGSGGFSISGYDMSWVRQFSDGKLQWLCYIYNGGGTQYYNDIKERFTVTRDNSKNLLTLKMDKMKTEDTAMYFCTRDTFTRAYFDVWGPGTFVTVSSASQSAPTLFPLISCGTSQTQSTTLGCLARDFLPDSISFSWRDKDNTTVLSGLRTYNSVLQSGGNYLVNSQVDVSTKSWENRDPFCCTAKHPQGDKTVCLQKQNGPRKPIVTIHSPIQGDVDENENATLVCVVSGFYPSNIDIKWQKNHNGPVKAITEGPVSDDNGGFSMTSHIVVTSSEWNANHIFSCIVNHSATDFNEMKNISKSAVCVSDSCGGDIKVTAIPPLFETIYMQNIAPLTCIISNMENKDGLEVSWYSGVEKLNTEIEDPTFNLASRKYNAKAIATVCPEDWRTKIFECRVSHPELPNVVVHTLSKPNGLNARPPTVLVFPPHQDELARKETATLSCMVKSFSPSDIFVKWIDSNNEEQSHVVTTAPMEEISSSSKKTYFLYSTLTLTNVEDWNSGKSFTCLVGHESLPLYTVQRTVDKSSGKPTNVNVSLVMSDTC